MKKCLLVVLPVLLAGCALIAKDEKVSLVSPLPEFETKATLSKDWRRAVGDQGDKALFYRITPVIADGIIYAANADGKVFAIDIDSGIVVWKESLRTDIIGAVGADEMNIYVGNMLGQVIALDAKTGAEKWRSALSSEVLAAPAGEAGVVAVQTIDSKLHGLSAEDGGILWTYSASQPVLSLRGTSSPVIENGIVYVVFDGGKVAALDLRTGIAKYEGQVIVPAGKTELERVIDIDGRPVIVGEDLYIASFQGSVMSLSKGTGGTQWELPASTVRQITAGKGQLFLVEHDGTVRAVRMGSGTESWRNDQFRGRELTGPNVIGDYLAVADAAGYVHLLTLEDGVVVGRYRIGQGGIRNDLIGTGERIFVLSNKGKLTALSLD